jgi:HAE1 family hydrophobic/amphiphilic exporter-1
MLSNTAIRRPVATAMILMMVVVVGVFGFINIQRDLFPQIEFPVALVITPFPDAGPEEVENLVTRRLESALASVHNLDMLWSVTTQGQSVVMIQFAMETDMDFATIDMRERIAMAAGILPEGAGEPMVVKMDMNALPVMNVFVSSDVMTSSQLYREVENNLLTYFERTNGVATTNLSGGIAEEIMIAVNPETLIGLGIGLPQIAQMLAAENINLPGGHVRRGQTEVIVRTLGEFNSIDDIRNLPISLADRSIIRLQDIANIALGYRDQTSIARINGEAAVSLTITRQSDANTVDVSNAIHRVVTDLSERFPELNIRVGLDQADYINQSLTALTRAALLGGLLAMLVVLLFLRSFKTTLVIGVSIPVSLLATFALMEARDITLNLVTLSALALAIGLLIDTSIIVLENIYRTKQTVDSPVEAATQGAREISLAVLAATLTTVAVFLPIALASGLTALMFGDFAFTLVIVLLVSLVVSLTAVPMLCSKLLSRGASKEHVRIGSKRYKIKLLNAFPMFIEWLTQQYEVAIRGALKRRKRVIVCCILIFVMSIGLLGVVGTELLPTTDEGTFQVAVEMPFGTPLNEIDAVMRDIEQYILALPEIRRAVLSIGSEDIGIMGGFFGPGGTGSISVTLVPIAERTRSTEEVVEQVRESVRDKIGADIAVNSTSMVGMMVGVVDMQIFLFGADLRILEDIGNDLIDMLEDLPEVGELELIVSEGNAEARVIIDRNIAAHYGINAAQLANQLNTALVGTTATRLRVGGDEIDVVVSLPATYRDSIDNMMQVMVTGLAGIPVPVGQIASIELDNAPSSIERMNQHRYLVLNIDIDSPNLATAATLINEVVSSYNFPDGYFFEAFGTQEELFDAFGGLLQALIIAVALAYLILAAQFESLLLPFIVTTSIPFAMSGAFLAMFISGTPLSMTSFLGLIMLVGIVTNNAILLVTFTTQNQRTMGRDESLVQAGKTRLRPILMTTVSTCAAMIPISLGIGEGTELMAPMGVAIIGGLIASTIITLLFVPVLYSIIDDNKTRRIMKKEMKMARIAALEAKWLEEDMQNAK